MTVLPDISRGDQVTIHIRDAVDEAGAPFVFTGWTVKFSATRWLGTPPVIAKSGTAVTIIGPGSADVVLAPADTAAAMDGTRAAHVLLYWDVEVSTATQGPHTLDSGTVTVRRDVTGSS